MFRSVLLKCSLRVAHYPSSSHGRTGPGRRLCPSPESPLLGRGQGCKSSLSCASGFLRYAPSFESSWFSSLFLTPFCIADPSASTQEAKNSGGFGLDRTIFLLPMHPAFSLLPMKEAGTVVVHQKSDGQ